MIFEALEKKIRLLEARVDQLTLAVQDLQNSSSESDNESDEVWRTGVRDCENCGERWDFSLETGSRICGNCGVCDKCFGGREPRCVYRANGQASVCVC